MLHMQNAVYVKMATVTQVPGLLAPPPPLHVAPSGAAAAHPVGPPGGAAAPRSARDISRPHGGRRGGGAMRQRVRGPSPDLRLAGEGTQL